jgi:hypothetical protein
MGAQYIEAVIVVCCILIILLPFFLLVLVFMLPLCPKSKCTAFWKRFPYVVLQIIGIPAFFGVLTMAMLTYQLKGYFVEHYDEYKCKPWFMPFVSWIKPDASTTGNFSDCLSQISRGVFASMTAPFIGLADELGTGMNLAHQNFGHVQNKHTRLGSAMVTMMSRHTNTMGKYQAMAQYLFLKVKAVFDKMLATVFDVYYALITMLDMVNIAVLMPQILVTGCVLFASIYLGITLIFLIGSILWSALGMSETMSVFLAALAPGSFAADVIAMLLSNTNLAIATTFEALALLAEGLQVMAGEEFKKRKEEQMLHMRSIPTQLPLTT